MQTAAYLIRSARLRAGLSQTELARLASIPQSMVSLYEGGKREPSFTTLTRIIAATGFRLETSLEAISSLQRRVFEHRAELLGALQALGASRVRLFGSTARGQDTTSSDVDLLVDLPDDAGLVLLGKMVAEAERILGVTVDIVPENGLKPDIAPHVLAEAIAL